MIKKNRRKSPGRQPSHRGPSAGTEPHGCPWQQDSPTRTHDTYQLPPTPGAEHEGTGFTERDRAQIDTITLLRLARSTLNRFILGIRSPENTPNGFTPSTHRSQEPALCGIQAIRACAQNVPFTLPHATGISLPIAGPDHSHQ